MSLHKKAMVRHVARHTELTQKQARAAVDVLFDLWMDALAEGQSIAVDNFLTMRVVRIERQGATGRLKRGAGAWQAAPRVQVRLRVTVSRALRKRLGGGDG